MAAAAVAGSVATAVVRTDRPEWSLAVPSLLVAVYSVARLVLWALTAGSPRRASSIDDRDRATAVLAEARTEIAVIAGDEPSVHVRTAVLSAIAASAQHRVLLVGADPRLGELARSLGVRHVPADGGWDAGVQAALAATQGELLLLSTATSAVVPGAISRVVDHLDAGCVWVQTTPSAPADRDVLDQFDHAVVQPGLDRRNAVAWIGPASIVAVDAFRTLHQGAPPAVVTRRLQARGWHGRFSSQTLVVPLTDRVLAPARGAQLPTLWARRVRMGQRLAALRSVVDDLAPHAAVVAVVTIAAAVALGEVPVPVDERLLPLLPAVALAALARLSLSRGLVRPGALIRADLDAVARPSRAAEAARAARADARPSLPGRAASGLRSLAVVLHLGLVAGAVRVVIDRRAGHAESIDVVLLGLGLLTSVAVLSAVRVLVRNRRMRVSRRVPVQVRVRVGDHNGRVVDLSADGFRLEMAAPATLLTVLGVRFQVEGRRPVDVRAQVVRVERSSRGWLVGARLLGGDSIGAHDEYLGMWLANAAAAANARPKIARVPHLGWIPVRGVGVPAVRLATALVALLLGVAALPVVVTRAAPTIEPTTTTTAVATPSSTTTTGPASTTTTTPATDDTTAVATADATGDTSDPSDSSAADPSTDDTSATSTSVLTGDVGGTTPTLQITTTAVSNDPNDTTEGQVRFGVLFTWQIEIRNISAVGAEGERVAHGVDVTDTLPMNWNYNATVSTVPASCDVAPVITPAEGVESIAWTDMCDLAPGQSVTITFAAMPQLLASTDPGLVDDAGVRVAHVNRVVLSAEDAEGTTLGTATASASAFPRLDDLQVRLTDAGADGDAATTSPGFVLGTIGRYRIDVRNGGFDSATGPITATVVLPVGIGLWTVDGEGWTCTPGLALVCTNPGPVPVDGALAPIHVEVAVGPTALNDADADGNPETGLVTASVSVTGADLDTDATTDTDTETTPVRRIADLDLATAPAAPMTPGVRFEEVLTVTNVGPSNADGLIVIDDPIPAGLRIVSAIGSGWSCGSSRVGRAYTADPDTNGVLDCKRTVKELPPGSVLPPLTLRLQPDPFLGATGVPTPTLPGTIHSYADPDSSNDTADRTASPAPVAALTISALDDRTDRRVGEELVTEVAVTNQGPAVEGGPVTVHADPIDGLDVTAAAGIGWSCSVDTTGWSCTWEGAEPGFDAVPPGSHLPPLLVTGTATAEAAAVSADESTLEQQVLVTGTTDATPHEATTTRTVRPTSELAIDAVTTTAPWVTGEDADLTVTVRAVGPSPEQGPVAITHLLPPGVEVTEVSGTGWTCDVRTGRDDGPSGTIACQHDRSGLSDTEPLLEVGASLPPIEVTLHVATTAMDTATIADDGRGSLAWGSAVRGTTDTTVRRSSGSTPLRRSVKVDATLSIQGNRIRVGDDVSATVTVTNDGSLATVDATTVKVTLPAGVSYVDVDGTGWGCTASGQLVSCTHDDPVAAGAAAPFDLHLAVAAAARATGNTATFSVVLGGATTPVTADVLVLAASEDEPVTTSTTVAAPQVATSHGGTSLRLDLDDPSAILGFAVAAAALAIALVLMTGKRRLPLC